MSDSRKLPISFRKALRIEILEAVKPRKLILYGITIITFSVFSLILPYNVLVYTSIVAGISMVLLLVASLVALRGFKRIDVVFIGGIVFLIIAFFPKELLISSFSTLEVLRDFKHLSRILSIALTALYVAVGVFKFAHIGSHGMHMKH